MNTHLHFTYFMDKDRENSAYHTVVQQIIHLQNDEGYWTGKLSLSALATATAVSALSLYRNVCRLHRRDAAPLVHRDVYEKIQRLIRQGVQWLVRHQNGDGGWGDTDKSRSNIATTMLVKSALLLSDTVQVSQRDDKPRVFSDTARDSVSDSATEPSGGVSMETFGGTGTGTGSIHGSSMVTSADLLWDGRRDKDFQSGVFSTDSPFDSSPSQKLGKVETAKAVPLFTQNRSSSPKTSKTPKNPKIQVKYRRSEQTDSIMNALGQADGYLRRHGGVEGIRRRYGKDRTFAVPILTNAALAGLVSWKEIPPLPFERAAVPHSLYRFLDMQVVSYAIPALVAIGIAHFHHLPPQNIFVKMIRQWAVQPTLKKVQAMQPQSGGFLEATPLTAFVVMSLVSAEMYRNPIVERGIEFLIRSADDESGAWPIDTNLATWVTSLATSAICSEDFLEKTEKTLPWLLSCQHREHHPFTAAAPGGWAWTNLSGGVPDADDTPGALLALANIWFFNPALTLGAHSPNPALTLGAVSKNVLDTSEVFSSAVAGLQWLLNMQNRDGGIPTFCRGWGMLPFDQSGNDLTAHTLRAMLRWRHILDAEIQPQSGIAKNVVSKEPKVSKLPKLSKWSKSYSPLSRLRQLRKKMDTAMTAMVSFLLKKQSAEGSWEPLWFGNQYSCHESNLVYGTAKVVLAFAEFFGAGYSSVEQKSVEKAIRRALDWFVLQQNSDGGFGATAEHDHHGHSADPHYSSVFSLSPSTRSSPSSSPPTISSVEETAVVVEALKMVKRYTDFFKTTDNGDKYETMLAAAREWLVLAVEENRLNDAAPIGLYFAKLWYYEQMYPLVFTAAALKGE